MVRFWPGYEVTLFDIRWLSPSGYQRLGACVALACLITLQRFTNRLLDPLKVLNDCDERRFRMGPGVRILVVSTLQVIGAIGASGLAGAPLG